MAGSLASKCRYQRCNKLLGKEAVARTGQLASPEIRQPIRATALDSTSLVVA